jgi:hypothetical protein
VTVVQCSNNNTLNVTTAIGFKVVGMLAVHVCLHTLAQNASFTWRGNKEPGHSVANIYTSR